jgi:NADH pyrophosphatase NudC (nudix superfamily)
VDVSQINGYLTPPERRVVSAVWRELSEEFGVSVETLETLMLEGE